MPHRLSKQEIDDELKLGDETDEQRLSRLYFTELDTIKEEENPLIDFLEREFWLVETDEMKDLRAKNVIYCRIHPKSQWESLTPYNNLIRDIYKEHSPDYINLISALSTIALLYQWWVEDPNIEGLIIKYSKNVGQVDVNEKIKIYLDLYKNKKVEFETYLKISRSLLTGISDPQDRIRFKEVNHNIEFLKDEFDFIESANMKELRGKINRDTSSKEVELLLAEYSNLARRQDNYSKSLWALLQILIYNQWDNHSMDLSLYVDQAIKHAWDLEPKVREFIINCGIQIDFKHTVSETSDLTRNVLNQN